MLIFIRAKANLRSKLNREAVAVAKIQISPNNPLVKNCVIPAQAGIQMINKPPRQWDNTVALPASRNVFYCWIPACAGMTA